MKDLYVDPITGGKYLTIDINREAIGRYGLSVDDVNMIVESAIGGTPIGQTIEGRQRFTISVRLAQDYRNSIDQLKANSSQNTESWRYSVISCCQYSV